MYLQGEGRSENVNFSTYAYIKALTPYIARGGVENLGLNKAGITYVALPIIRYRDSPDSAVFMSLGNCSCYIVMSMIDGANFFNTNSWMSSVTI